ALGEGGERRGDLGELLVRLPDRGGDEPLLGGERAGGGGLAVGEVGGGDRLGAGGRGVRGPGGIGDREYRGIRRHVYRDISPHFVDIPNAQFLRGEPGDHGRLRDLCLGVEIEIFALARAEIVRLILYA